MFFITQTIKIQPNSQPVFLKKS